MKQFILSGKNLQLSFPLKFLRMWFGKGTRLTDISPEEFERACRVCMRIPKNRIIAEDENVPTN